MAVKFSGGFKPPVGLAVKNPPIQVTTLTGAGRYSNIALLGSNSLVAGNFSASSESSGSFPAEAAFDGYSGDTTNATAQYAPVSKGSKQGAGQWRSSTGSNEWIQVDFGVTVSVAGFMLCVNRTLSNSSNFSPRNIIVQTSSDGTNFSNHESMELTQKHAHLVDLSTPAVAQYIRIYITDNWGGSYVKIDNLEFYQEGAPFSVAMPDFNGITSSDVTAGATYFADTPPGAVDGWGYNGGGSVPWPLYQPQAHANPTSRYTRGVWLGTGGAPNWIAVNMKSSRNIKSFRYWVAGASTRWPTAIDIQSSVDGTNWSTHESFTGIPTQGEVAFNLATPMTTQYVRAYVVTNGGDTLVNFEDLAFFEIEQGPDYLQ